MNNEDFNSKNLNKLASNFKFSLLTGWHATFWLGLRDRRNFPIEVDTYIK